MVRSDVTSMTPVNCLTSKTPVWCNILGSISYISRVLENFVFKNHQLVTMVTRVGLGKFG